MLIILGGLPGSGKTSLARAVALCLAASHLRIDTIEQCVERIFQASPAASTRPPDVAEA